MPEIISRKEILKCERIARRAVALARIRESRRTICCVCAVEFIGSSRVAKTCSEECRRTYGLRLTKQWQQQQPWHQKKSPTPEQRLHAKTRKAQRDRKARAALRALRELGIQI